MIDKRKEGFTRETKVDAREGKSGRGKWDSRWEREGGKRESRVEGGLSYPWFDPQVQKDACCKSLAKSPGTFLQKH